MLKRGVDLLIIVFAVFFFEANAQSVSSAGKKPVKILAIGNSFSEDAVEYHLSRLAKADSLEVIIGSLVVGGSTLEQHWKNVLNADSSYRYTKINWMENSRTVRKNTRLTDGIKDEEWDYITFQQVSHQSGIYASYFPYITDLIAFTKKEALNPKVEFAIHQTWAYNKESTHFGFANYNNDQMEMYNAIIGTVDKVAKEIGVNMIIPAGVAIQNGRYVAPETDFCRDGFHLSPIGRYVAACTWYEKILGKLSPGNSFCPTTLDTEKCRLAQEIAHKAVMDPSKNEKQNK